MNIDIKKVGLEAAIIALEKLLDQQTAIEGHIKTLKDAIGHEVWLEGSGTEKTRKITAGKKLAQLTKRSTIRAKKTASKFLSRNFYYNCLEQKVTTKVLVKKVQEKVAAGEITKEDFQEHFSETTSEILKIEALEE